MDLFNFKVDVNRTPKTARIETSSVAARDALREKLARFSEWKIDILLYPEDNIELNGKWRGVVRTSTIQLQKKPDHAAEWGAQSIMGSPVRILNRESNGWILIQNTDGYLGYTTSGSVQAMTKDEYDAWLDSTRLIWLEVNGFIYSQPNERSATISDLVAGCVVVWKDAVVENDFYKVETPDGRVGWIKRSGSCEWKEWLQTRELTGDNLITAARRLLGFPYVWGGNTTKGVDCSGLVHVAFMLNGYNILRDVSQIRREGVDVDLSNGWRGLEPGDLLIFGAKRSNGVTNWRHVGIYIGQGRFIHSATLVHESSLDPDSPDYDEYNAKQLIKVVRMIGADKTEHFHPIQDNSFYQKDER